MNLQKALTASCFLLLVGALPRPTAALDGSWLAEEPISHEAVTAALNEIWSLPAEQATLRANELRTLLPAASDEGRKALGWLIAVALERAQNVDAARTHYQKLTADGPYSTSASFRLRALEDPEDAPADEEAALKAVAADPSAGGWFLLSERWTWSTRQEAAQRLVELQEDRLSFRFFQLLRDLSPIQGAYGYLVVLLALALGVKLLELPLLVRTARFAVRMRPRMQALQRLREVDPESAQQQMMAMYQGEGAGAMSGCALSLVDMIFVVWAFVTLSHFAPQLVLDGARFLWASDVTRYNLAVSVLWVAVVTIQAMVNQQAMRQLGQSPAQILFGSLLFGSVVAAVARHWEWPAYVFVFWAILTTLSLLINKTFIALSEARA